jgi:hypothetical protein
VVPSAFEEFGEFEADDEPRSPTAASSDSIHGIMIFPPLVGPSIVLISCCQVNSHYLTPQKPCFHRFPFDSIKKPVIDHLFPPYTKEKVQAMDQWFDY